MGSRSPRGWLGLHVVLDAALEIIDRVGVDGLSIRGLAQELGRPPMTLYGHFDSKRELLDLAFVRLVAIPGSCRLVSQGSQPGPPCAFSEPTNAMRRTQP